MAARGCAGNHGCRAERELHSQAVWNAYYDLPYNAPSMHEVVFSDTRQAKKGVRTGDIAKRLIDYGFHPYTVSFPLIVPGALMIEPTETEAKLRTRLVYRCHDLIAKEIEKRRSAGAQGAASDAYEPRR